MAIHEVSLFLKILQPIKVDTLGIPDTQVAHAGLDESISRREGGCQGAPVDRLHLHFRDSLMLEAVGPVTDQPSCPRSSP